MNLSSHMSLFYHKFLLKKSFLEKNWPKKFTKIISASIGWTGLRCVEVGRDENFLAKVGWSGVKFTTLIRKFLSLPASIHFNLFLLTWTYEFFLQIFLFAKSFSKNFFWEIVFTNFFFPNFSKNIFQKKISEKNFQK